MTKIQWGGLIVSTQPYDQMLELCRYLEDRNFSSFWYPDEKFFRDCYIGLALAASKTKQIRLGPCVTDPYSRHPIQTAVSIGSLADIAPGRVVLGMGAGGRGLVEIGLRPERAAVAIREAVEIIRRLLAGEAVEYNGEVQNLKKLPLDFSPPPNIPIMIATGHGKYVQRLAGEIANIVMLANFASVETITKALREVEIGAKRGNRTLHDFELIARIDVAVADDGDLARKAVAPRILSALRSSYPNLNYLDALPDFDMSSRLIQALNKKDHETKQFYANPDNSAPLIPSILTRNFACAGTPKEVAARLQSIVEMGLFTEITVSMIATEGQSLSDAFHIFAEKVIPLVD